MLGATSTSLPTSARRPLFSIPWPRGGRLDPLYWVSAYGRRPKCPYGGAYPYCREPYLPPPPSSQSKGTCPYGGTWPYCNEPTQMAMSGFGFASPAIAPSFRQGYDIVGTGPRRPPPPPLSPTRLFGLGMLDSFAPEQKTTLVTVALGATLIGVGLGYFAWGR